MIKLVCQSCRGQLLLIDDAKVKGQAKPKRMLIGYIRIYPFVNVYNRFYI
jgi:hypothetical protein